MAAVLRTLEADADGVGLLVGRDVQQEPAARGRAGLVTKATVATARQQEGGQAAPAQVVQRLVQCFTHERAKSTLPLVRDK